MLRHANHTHPISESVRYVFPEKNLSQSLLQDLVKMMIDQMFEGTPVEPILRERLRNSSALGFPHETLTIPIPLRTPIMQFK